MEKALHRLLLTLSVAALLLSPAAAVTYNVTDLGTLIFCQYARSVNNAGQVAGARGGLSALWTNGSVSYSTPAAGWQMERVANVNSLGCTTGNLISTSGDRRLHAFISRGGVAMEIGTMGGANSYGYAVNDLDQVVGASETGKQYPNGSNELHAFIWQDGVYTDLNAGQGPTVGVAYDINNRGQVVGYDGGYAWMWENGRLSDLASLPGNAWATPSAVNENGQCVGSSRDGSDNIEHPIFWNNAAPVLLPSLGGGDAGWAYDINDLGQIVGMSQAVDGTLAPTLWTGGQAVSINGLLSDPSWDLEMVYGINNAGQIAGYAHRNGAPHRYSVLLTVPEPGSLIAVLFGCIGLVRFRRR